MKQIGGSKIHFNGGDGGMCYSSSLAILPLCIIHGYFRSLSWHLPLHGLLGVVHWVLQVTLSLQ